MTLVVSSPTLEYLCFPKSTGFQALRLKWHIISVESIPAISIMVMIHTINNLHRMEILKETNVKNFGVGDFMPESSLLYM